ncbi:PIN domain-containing protein [Saccharolobus solfataricus]|uniref:PIN domain-containing protein n=1 Tax=Saccharolobus solfataricus TaxID=2287 RepID=A0A0E3K1D9_SACSO|nr:type II toxin-antitoxin system VapC family toxin [Saccharolobus solfataricus]AKA74522.2 PIN domain-containing protein [Saccharolobus solfataricus]AKA77218.2 PIN domain-containing protein [Saccharolobus solfataricus]AKA79910.2 PIN domain-containing protein [Saccharolobus solfataricus]AZF69000.1 PIN domain-containing protein [Saccharolobus solfataricus]AZF71620.1 PIN domain-containing protein [Saccharolobus solfataricus]
MDASVLAKFVTKEKGWEKIREILKDAETLDFALVEVSNVVWKKAVLTGELTGKDVIKAITIVKEYLPQLLTVNKSIDLIERAIEISVNEKITVYDSLYIALAECKGSKLVTGDKKQYDVAKKYVISELI